MLLERPGEVVTREQLNARLWPNGTVVEFDHGINSCIRRLRAVLNDSAEQPRYIETLPKRGYRFIFPCECSQRANAAAPSQNEESDGLIRDPTLIAIRMTGDTDTRKCVEHGKAFGELA